MHRRKTGALIAAATTVLTVPLAFGFAYAMQRTCIPYRSVWRSIALIPILAPSLLSFDIWVMLVMGVFGYTARKLKFDLGPLLLAFVLGIGVWLSQHIKEAPDA